MIEKCTIEQRSPEEASLRQLWEDVGVLVWNSSQETAIKFEIGGNQLERRRKHSKRKKQ